MPRHRAHLELHLAVAVLSLTAILGKLLHMGVVQAIAGRSAIAAAALGLVLLARGDALRLPHRGDQRWNLIAGVLLALHWITFFQAVRTGSVAVGMLGLFTFPVMLTFLEPLVFREPLKRWSVVHGLVVLAGLALVVPELSLSNAETAGLAWGMLSAALYAVRNLMNRRFVHAHGSMRVMFWQVLVAGVVLSPALLVPSGANWPIDLLWLLVLGVLCTAMAHTMFIASFRHFRVATASIILTLEPLYAAALAIPIFGEWPSWQTCVGGAIILAAIAHESYRHGRVVDRPDPGPRARHPDASRRDQSSPRSSAS